MPVLKKALVSSRLVFSNYVPLFEEDISSPFICLSGESHFRPESKLGHREEWETKVIIFYSVARPGTLWFCPLPLFAQVLTLQIAVGSYLQPSRGQLHQWVNSVNYWSTQCSPSRVPLGSSAHAAEVALEHAWVWGKPCHAPAHSWVVSSPAWAPGCASCLVPSQRDRKGTDVLSHLSPGELAPVCRQQWQLSVSVSHATKHPDLWKLALGVIDGFISVNRLCK